MNMNYVSMKPALLLLCVVLFHVSCEQNNSDILLVEIGGDLLNPEEVFVSDVAAEMKIVPLETNDSCLIGRGRNFDWMKQGILLNDVGLVKFDTTGHFLGNVFHFGQGPGELPALNDYYVEDSLIYLTGLAKDLHIYSYGGRLLAQYSIPLFTHNGFAALGNGKFVTGTLEWGNGDKSGRLQFFDTLGIRKTLYKPYSTEGRLSESYPMGDEIKFFPHKDTVYMKELLCDTIYVVDAERDTILPFLAYDFGSYKTRPEYRYNYSPEELFIKIPYTQFLGVSDEYVYLVVMMADIHKKESIDMLCIYNRKSKSSRLVRLSYSEKDIQVIKSKIGNNFDEKVSRYFVPVSLSQDGKYLCTLLPQITDENPAIVAIRLK